ncbi:acyltransferase family protein [Thermoflexibacter ruber]|uniref:Acyltransferase family protein n=1 Tax=Thermoflexibacter ruber TaxID=1003 RepID=A0A1I2JZR4_9BACT|nr:acyltransferase family protein [Thermoflexibacter ruber]SFF59410.1 Acyltransferase family protein [Thermoflexibacter ruber]
MEKVRHYQFDWVRILAFALLIAFHISCIFTRENWYIVNAEKSQILTLIFKFISQWRIPLLFFISGAVLAFAIKPNAISKYITNRVIRLLIPLFFSMVVVNVPISFYSALFNKSYQGSFWDFYAYVLENKQFHWQHLWYVAYLFVYSLLALPLFIYVLKNKVNFNNFIAYFIHKIRFLLLFLPLILVHLSLVDSFPITHLIWGDWYFFTFNFVIFMYGFLFANSNTLIGLVHQHRLRFLLVVISLTFLLIIFERLETNAIIYYIFKILKPAYILLCIVTIIAFAHQYLSFNHKWISYLSQAIYPFYILHMPITVIIGYYVVALNLNLYIKFIILKSKRF